MIAAIALLAVSLANLPVMLPDFSVGEADYPTFALRYEHEGVVGFHVAVDAGGQPHDCLVTTSSTFAELDARTCEIVTARMRFTPAHDRRGRAVAASFNSRVRWKITPGEEEAFADGTTTTNLTFTPQGGVASCKVDVVGPRAKNGALRCDDLPGGLATLLGTPLIELAAARLVFALRTGIDTAAPPEGLPGGTLRMAVSVRIAIGEDGRIAGCVPIDQIMANRVTSDPCGTFPIGKPAYAAVPPGTERHAVYGFYISVQRRPGRM